MALERSQRRFSEKQYQLLLQCSEQRDSTRWNKWRQRHPKLPVLLEGADFRGRFLNEALLGGAQLHRADFEGASLQGTNMCHAHATGARFSSAQMQACQLHGADLTHADLRLADLTGSWLEHANLRGAYLNRTCLVGSRLQDTHLESATITGADLCGADFTIASADGETIVWNCVVDKSTGATGLPLEGARIEPGLRLALQYNVRRSQWTRWYNNHPMLKWPARFFWAMSDYGHSSARIVSVFCGITFLFATLYCCCERICGHPLVANLGNIQVDSHSEVFSAPLLMLRSLYFSVVTMTTLGYGDMYANPMSKLAYCVVTLQVLLGYAILGALVTRFAILFTSGGPAVAFARMRAPRNTEISCARPLVLKAMESKAPGAIFLVRLAAGGVFLSEGIQKFLFPVLLGPGRFTNIGFAHPEFMAYFVAVCEVACGSLILAGLLTRLAAIPTTVIMAVAIVTTKLPMFRDGGFWKMAHEARTDYAMFLGSILLIVVGAGWFSFDYLLTKRLQPKRCDAGIRVFARRLA